MSELHFSSCILYGVSACKKTYFLFVVFLSYSNIFVTSPSPDNLHTLFEFVFKGFDALQYQVILTKHGVR